MSEFSESYSISKLIGAPAGYVGYREGAKLTDSVKRRPYSVVLFDEMEKAHPQIFNLLLQILEEGHVTDATGKAINFRNTIIIMTSNLGMEQFNRTAALGFEAKTDDQKLGAQLQFEEMKRKIDKELKMKFRPEFLNRIDKTVIFNPLSAQAITQISQLQLRDLKIRLAERGVRVNFGTRVAAAIGKRSYSPDQGARAIRRTIHDAVENRIAEKILQSNKKTFRVQLRGQELNVT